MELAFGSLCIEGERKRKRSTCNYQQKAIKQEKIDQIVEAGRYAPSGGSNQMTHFFVIKDCDMLKELAQRVKAEFAKTEVTPGMYPSLAHAIRASKGEEYVFHYSAPVLIVTANKKDCGNNIADCACALENMMLTANDLDSCWTNQLR